MAQMTKKAKAKHQAKAVKKNPYIRQIVEDEDLRRTLWEAYGSARDAYSRLSRGKAPHKAIFDDKKLQKDLKRAAHSIQEASVTFREAPKRGRKRFKRLVLLAVMGGTAALAVSEDLRNKVLDLLFGKEEKFDYTPTTTTSSSASSNGDKSKS